jgi:hypothetical protein
MRRPMMILIMYALGGLSGCPPDPDPHCGPNGATVRSALVAIQIAGVTASIGVQILISQGKISGPDATTAQSILDKLSIATQNALAEAGSNDDEKTCYSTIAKDYTPVLETIPGVPSGTAAQINVVIDLVDVVLNLVGVTPPPHSADRSLSHESTFACLEGEVQS